MIAASEWWAGLVNYNSQLFPFQLVVMVLAIILTVFLHFRPRKYFSTIMKIFLSFSMLFNGITFFILFGKKLPSPLKYFQGGLFITIGILFAIDVFTGWSELKLPKSGKRRYITCILFVLTALYPVFGLLRGHEYTQLIYPGTLPCGSTAFALVVLSASVQKVNKLTYILLLVWAIPFAPLIQIPQFKVYEDAIMFLIGIYSLGVLLIHLKKRRDYK
jgi:hypothetical protein